MIISPQKKTDQVKKTDSQSAEIPAPKKPTPRKKWVFGLVAGGLLIIPGSIYGIYQHNKPKTDDLEKLTVRVEAQNITLKINSSGSVQPVQRVNLSPKNSGRIAELYVEQGDRVQEGQVIARMESRDIEAQLQQAQARLANAQARLDKAKAGTRPEQIAQASARLTQFQAKLDQLRAGSRVEEVTQAQARLAQVEANLAQLRAGNRSEEIAQAEAKLRQAQTRFDDAKMGTLNDEIAQAQSQLKSAEAEAKLTAQRLERNKELITQGAISQDQFDELSKANLTANAKVEEAQRRVQQLQQNQRSQIAQLEQGVEQEKQNVKQIKTGTRAEAITKAEAEVAEAKGKLTQVLNGSRPEEIQDMEAQVREAKSKLDELVNGSRPEEIAQAEADVAEASAQVRYNQVLLEDTKVRAPFGGIITQRYAIQGAFVTPATSASSADSATSTSIVALAKDLEVLAKLPEADISRIKPGQDVEIVADSYPDQVFKGKVKLIAPEAVKEKDVTLFQVRIKVETGKDKLQSGMNVDLRFLGNKLKDALVLPTVAIVTNKGKPGVLIPDEKNRPKFNPVITGSNIGKKIQVLEGVKAGDRVFIELPEGQTIDKILKNTK